MRRSFCWLALVILSGLWLPSPAQASGLSKQQFAEQRRFAANNSLFVLYHEMAHLLIDQFELPVMGREEDAADNFASWILLNTGTARADQVLSDAVRGWFLSGIAYDSGGTEADYATAHVLDKQRAYQIVCLMVGKDRVAFGPVAERYYLPRERQEACRGEYGLVERSLGSLLQNEVGKRKAGREVSVHYYAVAGSLGKAADAFRSSGVFDEVAEALRTRFSLRAPVQLSARRCGEANAFYDTDSGEIIFCYELMQDYMDIYADHMEAPEAAPPRAGKHQAPRAPRHGEMLQ